MSEASPARQTRTTGHTRVEAAAILLLVLAGLANLPPVYLLLRAEGPVWLILLTGLLSMGLGWAAGLHLERKRPAAALALTAIGCLEAFAARAASTWDATAGAFMLVGAACSLAALACAWRAR